MKHKAVILAAGLGSRLENLTEEVPKAIVKVAGRSIIDYQLHALNSNNINVTTSAKDILRIYSKNY